jgi:choline dehydrogenase
VGSNLQDHLEIYVQQKCTQPITLYNQSSWRFPHNMIRTGLQWFAMKTGLASSSHLESGGFARSTPEVAHPDIQFHFLPSTVHDDGRVVGTCHAYQVHVGPMRSKSVGHIRLRSTDPRMHPIIQPNYLSHEQDFIEFRRCIEVSREIFAQKAFEPFRGEELAPGENCTTNEQIDEFVRSKAASAYHPSCTCKMGRSDDPMAVVDGETMNVHGLEGLKIADASVMPSIVSGNLNAPTIMIAEKAADIIAGKKPLPIEEPPIWIPSAK